MLAPMPVRQKKPGQHHHGDLRRALLDALAEAAASQSPEALSLRDLARRAGVAHSAAAPHFGDKRGLLTAFAAEGFQRLAGSQRAAMAAAPPDPAAQLAASGLGYIAFARDNPGHFRVMLRGALLDPADPALRAGREAAWAPMEAALTAGTPGLDAAARLERMLFAWSGVHGFATLAAEAPEPLLAHPGGLAGAAEAVVARVVAACLRP
jgi:AcrR family transcriptional regulator